MSNYLAIATVTATFRELIAQAIQKVRPISAGPRVLTGRPKTPEPGFVGVNLYLYQVEANGALRNQALPTRNQEGLFIDKPQTALNLNYLLTFYGKAQQQEPERLMGKLISSITEKPILTPDFICETINAAENDSYLLKSDLAKQCELVRLTPIFLNLEQLSKLWTIFDQVTHDLSIAYQASVVLIDSEVNVPQSHKVKTVEPKVKLNR